MIYRKDQKPTPSPIRERCLRQFWNYNLNPITGFVMKQPVPIYNYDATAEISPLKKPAFRLAI